MEDPVRMKSASADFGPTDEAQQHEAEHEQESTTGPAVQEAPILQDARQRQGSNGATSPHRSGDRQSSRHHHHHHQHHHQRQHIQQRSGECRLNLSDRDDGDESGWDSSGGGHSATDYDRAPAGRDSDSDLDDLPPRLSLLGWRLPRSYLLWLVNAFNAWRLWLFLTGFSIVTAAFSSTVIIANNLISLGLLSARYNRSLAIAETKDWPDFALFVLWWVASVVPFVMLSCLLVQLCSPIAAGSGIPELRCFLSNAYREKSLLGARALLTRVLGLILALNSGLPVGMLGPNVHMSCCIAHLLMFGHRLHRQVRPDPRAAVASGRFSSCLRATRVLASAAFKTLEPWTWEHQEMMCVAAAVGVACTFNAPISGVLFSIELTTKYFAVNTYWRGFYCNIVATMAMSILMTGMRHSSIAGEYLIGSAIAMAKSEDRSVQSADLASFAGLGLLAGLVSVVFLRFYRLCLKTGSRRLVAWAERRLIGRSADSKTNYWRPRFRALAYCLFASLFLALLTCPAHRVGRGSLSQVRQFDQLRQLFAHTSWRRQLLAPEPAVEYVANATVSQDSPVGFSPHLRPGGDFSALMKLLLHFALLKLICAAVTLTLAIPSGVFMPTFVAGAAIGRLYGELSGHDHPVWFVLAGAAAFSGAATGTLSTSLIVFEVTGDISLIIPTILSVLIANFAMHACRTLSFYDLGIRIKRLPHAPITCPKLLARCARIRVSQVMLPPESTVQIRLSDTNDQLRRLLRRHQNFESLPLVQDNEAGEESGKNAPGNSDGSGLRQRLLDHRRPLLLGQVSVAAAHRYLRRGLRRACADVDFDTENADDGGGGYDNGGGPQLTPKPTPHPPPGLSEQLAVLDAACDLRVLGPERLTRKLGLRDIMAASSTASSESESAGARFVESDSDEEEEAEEGGEFEGCAAGGENSVCNRTGYHRLPSFVHRSLVRLCSKVLPDCGKSDPEQEARTRAYQSHMRCRGIPRWAEFLSRRIAWGRGRGQLTPSEVDVACGPGTGLDRALHLHCLARQRQLLVACRGRLVSVLPAGRLYRGLRLAFSSSGGAY